MKKFLLLFGLVSFLVCAPPVSAASNVCNKVCQVNEDCGQGYRCYVGICRALACPSSPSCSCAAPTSAPAANTNGVENLRVPATPTPKTAPIATTSSPIKKAPTTGASIPELLFICALLAVAGFKLKTFAKNA